MLKRFIKEETGQTAIEYGLLAAMMAVAMIAAFQALGTEYIVMFDHITESVINA